MFKLNSYFMKTSPYLKKTRVTAILKLGKPSEDVASYRPIVLLSVCYKLLKRIMYNHIMPTINNVIPIEQAGFRPICSCCDLVLTLTTHIKASFKMGNKTTTAFIDLTGAYDTVWHEGILLKFLRVIPCKTITLTKQHA